MRRYFIKPKKNNLEIIEEDFSYFLDESEKIKEEIINDTSLDKIDFDEQLGIFINNIKLEVQKNKLNIIRIDELLKQI